MDNRIIYVALACLLVGGVAGWFLRGDANWPHGALPARTADADGDREPDADEEVEPARVAEIDVGDAALVTPEEAPVLIGHDELDIARTKLNEERALREKLQQELLVARREIEEAKRPKAVDKQAVKGPHFTYEQYQKVLQDMNWQEAGSAIAQMGPLLVKLADAMANNKPYIQLAGDIQRHNGALMRIAGAASDGGLPGEGVNGAFTHPALLANLVHATLRESGKPLDEAQEAKLAQLGTQFVEEDARRLLGYNEQTFALQKLIDETDLKDRFYAAVDNLVTDEQREILHPASLRGRMTFDLFSSGLVYAQRVAPLRYRTQEDLESSFVKRAMAGFGIGEEQKPIVVAAVSDWANSFPAGFLTATPDSMSLQGRFKIERVRVAARVSLAFYRSLLDRLPAHAEAAKAIRGAASFGMPLKRP